MITLFHVFPLISTCAGCALGMNAGTKLLHVPGGIAGALLGGCLGLAIGRIPERLALRLVFRNLRRMTVAELRNHLHSPDCLIPNAVLLELRRRGENVRQELPVVLDMLVSENTGCRGQGWAALTSAFPELAEKIRDYRIGDSVDDCRKKTAVLKEVD